MEKISVPSGFGSDFSERSDNTVIKGFSDDKICGEGASCLVYRMRLGGLLVAVKRLRPEYCTNPAFVASYRKEFQIGQKLKHDALPVYREFHEDLEDVYIIMDYVDGISILDFLQTDEGKVYFSSQSNVRRFLTEILNVIAYLHRSGVIHCDIKPSNIMLRHSDRGVMLLDLDKSYSDTLDRTHGGTLTVSNPLTEGNKPTAQKDYAAIGRLLEIFEGSVPDFPKRKFRRFHMQCSQDNNSPEILIDAIKKPSRSKYWFLGIFVCLVASFGFLRWFDISDVTDPQIESTSSVKDTVIVINNIHDSALPVNNFPAERESNNKVMPIAVTVEDFDMKMSEFTHNLDENMQSLRSGNISDGTIRELMRETVEKYTSRYGELLSNYKETNPEMPSLEVELALAQASEKSNASRLLHQFTQTAVDTLRKRHPELYDDL